jgi:hypothetical protein
MAIETISQPTGKMRVVKILSDVLVSGRHVRKGALVNIPEADAFTLCAAGQAELSKPEAKAVTA